MSRERAGHTLQTTAILNEAYLRLVDDPRSQKLAAGPASEAAQK
jgi:ECF sigma factor